MTDAEKIRALVGYRMEQAADALQAARTLIDAGLPRDAVNRAYYAIFYSVLALLVTRRLGTSKTQRSLTLFSREFVKTGLLPQEMSRLARRAFESEEYQMRPGSLTCMPSRPSTTLPNSSLACRPASGMRKETTRRAA